MLKELNSTLSQPVNKSVEYSEEKGVQEVEYYGGGALPLFGLWAF